MQFDAKLLDADIDRFWRWFRFLEVKDLAKPGLEAYGSVVEAIGIGKQDLKADVFARHRGRSAGQKNDG